MHYELKKSNLNAYLKALSKKREVIVPQENANSALVFNPLTEASKVNLNAHTDFAPQKWLQPPQEKIFEFHSKSTKKNKFKELNINACYDNTKRILFGVRSCDTHAIEILDRVFLDYYSIDPYYKKRRNNMLIVALACNTNCKNGFCTSLGTETPINQDALFIEKKNHYLIETCTKKGKEIIVPKYCKKTKTISKPKLPVPNCTKTLKTKNIAQNLNLAWKHPVFREEAKRCLSCSSCTMVCPACYCFIVKEEPTLKGSSVREKEWDSCQLLRFSRLAGDHYIRKSRESRLRQWLFHKFLYFPEHHGTFGCTGCGRCITFCPAGIDLTKMLNKIQKNPALKWKEKTV